MDKKIAMIIAFKEFRDEEYFIHKKIFELGGFKVDTISSSLGTAVGKLGGEAKVDFSLKDFSPAGYDAVLFIGGPGAQKYIDSQKCHQIAQETIENNKILGAICIAPAILARAGLLKNKKATVWSSPMDKSAVKILKEEGVFYQSDKVVVDGNIITASGPEAAKEFALKVTALLKNKQ